MAHIQFRVRTNIRAGGLGDLWDNPAESCKSNCSRWFDITSNWHRGCVWLCDPRLSLPDNPTGETELSAETLEPILDLYTSF